jgi:hypothetical protein
MYFLVVCYKETICFKLILETFHCDYYDKIVLLYNKIILSCVYIYIYTYI